MRRKSFFFVLRETASAIIFFGVLVQNPLLKETADYAFEELSKQGYVLPTAENPLRVYPLENDAGSGVGEDAGLWKPGVIYLRSAPKGRFGPEIYLRHELLHEVSFRTCKGKLPIWAEEASAMSFSSEVELNTHRPMPMEEDLERLRRAVEVDSTLDTRNLDTLLALLGSSGWPSKACEKSWAISEILNPKARTNTELQYVLINLISGRVYEFKGDFKKEAPLGSIVKIPFAASLKNLEQAQINSSLLKSDTEYFLSQRSHIDWYEYKRLLLPLLKIRGKLLSLPSDGDLVFWRALLGERLSDGRYLMEASLIDAALLERLSLLARPDLLRGLSKNVEDASSTLSQAPEAIKEAIVALKAIAKTGTTSNEKGNPLWGHVLLAWPSDNPTLLAVFRKAGTRGAHVLDEAAPILKRWRKDYDGAKQIVRVNVLAKLPRSHFELDDFDEVNCPKLSLPLKGLNEAQLSTCGALLLHANSSGARPLRIFRGILGQDASYEGLLLLTDPETYADSVLEAEAADLRSEAKKALRSVILWNGLYGTDRHPETHSVCDTTHCMVFLGELPEEFKLFDRPKNFASPLLMKQLTSIAARNHIIWLPFSAGGLDSWEKSISMPELIKIVNEEKILGIQRVLRRDGAIYLDLEYATSNESIPCEVFTKRANFPSCPDKISFDSKNNAYTFRGIGQGHSMGLNIEWAREAAKRGVNAEEILEEAYGGK